VLPQGVPLITHRPSVLLERQHTIPLAHTFRPHAIETRGSSTAPSCTIAPPSGDNSSSNGSSEHPPSHAASPIDVISAHRIVRFEAMTERLGSDVERGIRL
jgi:hypothetical protein